MAKQKQRQPGRKISKHPRRHVSIRQQRRTSKLFFATRFKALGLELPLPQSCTLTCKHFGAGPASKPYVLHLDVHLKKASTLIPQLHLSQVSLNDPMLSLFSRCSSFQLSSSLLTLSFTFSPTTLFTLLFHRDASIPHPRSTLQRPRAIRRLNLFFTLVFRKLEGTLYMAHATSLKPEAGLKKQFDYSKTTFSWLPDSIAATCGCHQCVRPERCVICVRCVCPFT